MTHSFLLCSPPPPPPPFPDDQRHQRQQTESTASCFSSDFWLTVTHRNICTLSMTMHTDAAGETPGWVTAECPSVLNFKHRESYVNKSEIKAIQSLLCRIVLQRTSLPSDEKLQRGRRRKFEVTLQDNYYITICGVVYQCDHCTALQQSCSYSGSSL